MTIDKTKAFFQKLGAHFGIGGDVSQADIDAALDAENEKKAAEAAKTAPPPKPEPTEMEKAVAAAVAAQVAPLEAKIVELENRPNGPVSIHSLADAEKTGVLENMKADYAAYQKELAASHYPYTAR
jgi:hypothetical protein